MEEHSIDLRVRYAEVDRQDVVYHAHYLHWFDMGRTEYLRAQGLCYSELEAKGLLLMVIRAEVRYHAPARLYDQIRLTTRPSWRTRSRICFEYQAFRASENRPLVSGTTELCCVMRAGKACPLPPELAQVLAHLPTEPVLLRSARGERQDKSGPGA